MAAKSLAIKPDLDPDRRRNLAIAAAIFGVMILVLVVKVAFRHAGTEELNVVATGYQGIPMKAIVELKDLSGTVVAHGDTNPATGVFVVRVPPGTYMVEATVPVKETEVGLPNIYPVRDTVSVLEGAAAPVRLEIKFGNLEPYEGFPGKYRGHRD